MYASAMASYMEYVELVPRNIQRAGGELRIYNRHKEDKWQQKKNEVVFSLVYYTLRNQAGVAIVKYLPTVRTSSGVSSINSHVFYGVRVFRAYIIKDCFVPT